MQGVGLAEPVPEFTVQLQRLLLIGRRCRVLAVRMLRYRDVAKSAGLLGAVSQFAVALEGTAQACDRRRPVPSLVLHEAQESEGFRLR